MFAPKVAKSTHSKTVARPLEVDPVTHNARRSSPATPTGRALDRDFSTIPVRTAMRDAAFEDGARSIPSHRELSIAFARTTLRDDAAADRTARLLGADAVTIGNSILFRSGHFSPQARSALIAHELVHVVHHDEAGRRMPLRSVSGDILVLQYTRPMIELMTDSEIGENLRLLQAHCLEHPGDKGAEENLSVLEAVARLRMERARQTSAAPPATSITASQAEKATRGNVSKSDEEHGTVWHALHRIGLVTTKHERAELLRKAWGPESGAVVTDRDGDPIEVRRLSDDEVIALNDRLRNVPIGGVAAIAAVSWPLGTDGTGKLHGELPNVRDAQAKISSMTREQLEQSAEELEKSIATRQAEQLRLGEEGAHRARIEQERDLLRAIKKALGGS